MSAERTLRYRPAIDGLRALAILPVVLFHYRVPGFGGGFVGVDVFFVISGYLITQLIENERLAGRFSILRFYERRVRRIFPALFAMLAVVTVAAGVVFFPADLIRYANSLLATAFFGSNFEFWREASYFDVIGEEKPLLHLWSIAVEEQFYLLFPAVLLLAGRWRRSLLAVGAILVASFLYSAWGVEHAPTATFYLLPGRAWELMLGALLALKPWPSLRAGWLSEMLSLLGLAAIAIAIFLFTRDTPFPGPAAALPCLGAALILCATEGVTPFVGRILSIAPLAFVGRISYSLYLWHWPLYVFAHYLTYRGPSPEIIALLVLLSFVLATASYFLVEQPVRRGQFAPPRLFAGGMGAIAVSALAALVMLFGNGLPERLRPDLRTILAEEDDHEPRIDTCFGLSSADVRNGRLCHIGASGAPPSFLLWGDSHADAVLPAIAEVAKREHRGGVFAGGNSCPPLLNVSTPRADCRVFNEAVLARALRPDIREIILDARWAKYAEGTTYGDEPEGRVRLTDSRSGAASDDDNHAVFARGLERTIEALSGKKVIIVAAVPEIGWPVPAVLAREKLAAKMRISPPSEQTYLARQKFVMATLAQLEHDDGVTVVYPHEVLCRSGICAVSLNGTPLYRDEHHLSVFGARQLAPLISRAL